MHAEGIKFETQDASLQNSELNPIATSYRARRINVGHPYRQDINVTGEWDVCDSEKKSFRGDFVKGEKYFVKATITASLKEEVLDQRNLEFYEEIGLIIMLTGLNAHENIKEINFKSLGSSEIFFEFSHVRDNRRSSDNIGVIEILYANRIFCTDSLMFK